MRVGPIALLALSLGSPLAAPPRASAQNTPRGTDYSMAPGWPAMADEQTHESESDDARRTADAEEHAAREAEQRADEAERAARDARDRAEAARQEAEAAARAAR